MSTYYNWQYAWTDILFLVFITVHYVHCIKYQIDNGVIIDLSKTACVHTMFKRCHERVTRLMISYLLRKIIFTVDVHLALLTHLDLNINHVYLFLKVTEIYLPCLFISKVMVDVTLCNLKPSHIFTLFFEYFQ